MSDRRRKSFTIWTAANLTGVDTPETLSGLLVSLLFWICLLLAAMMFAVVVLSPKLIEQSRLREQFLANQANLISIEHQNEQIQRVVDAIRHDKEFAAELTRVEFDAVRPDEEIIPVASDLRLAPQQQTAVAAPAPSIPSYGFLEPFAEHDSLRMNLLAASATLVIVSFTWLQPAHHPFSRRTVRSRSFRQIIRGRYMRPETTQGG